MSRSVLDASAILAFVLGEDGTATAKEAIDGGSVVSAVNHSEVVSKLIESIGDEVALEDALGFLTYEIVDFDADLAVRTARLRPLTRTLGLSLGDRACLALALREDLPVVTADRQWSHVDLGLDIRLAR